MKKMTRIWFISMVLIVFATACLFYGIAELTGFTKGDWPEIAILSEVILGILVYCWFVSQSKEAIEEEHKRAIWIRSVIGIVTASLIILWIVDQINVGQMIEIIVLLGLVLITAEYARHTQIMAKEMERQRYDTLRPIINVEVPQKDIFHLVYARSMGINLPAEVEGVLHNVGAGYATDVYSYVRVEGGGEEDCQLRYFGSLSKDGTLDKHPLALLKRDEYNGSLLVVYRDVYNRYFASIRELNIVGTAESEFKLEISPLEAVELPIKEKPKSYEDIRKAIKEALKDLEPLKI